MILQMDKATAIRNSALRGQRCTSSKSSSNACSGRLGAKLRVFKQEYQKTPTKTLVIEFKELTQEE
jgi:hypothetical protein